MKKSMFVSGFVLLVVIVMYISFNIYTNKSYGMNEEVKLKTINIDSKEVQNLKSILVTSEYLRDGYYKADNLDQETMLKQILLSLKDEDYKEKNVRPTKVMCLVKRKLWFISSDTCKVRIISNDTIAKYAMKLFNYEEKIEIEETKFRGLHCKYSNGYYCHVTYYKDSYHDYSLLDKAYKDKDSLYLYEYYLRTDDANNDECLKYYGEEYCSDKKKELPNISDSLIKNDGVYYRHTFKMNKNKEYYLDSSEVVY